MGGVGPGRGVRLPVRRPPRVQKGGTSLSKAYRAIQRFSEDIDLTLDVRHLLAEEEKMTPDGMPPSRSQADKWTKRVRSLLPGWVAGTLVPALQWAQDRDGLAATIRVDVDKVYIDHEPVVVGTGYASPSVLLELGARATGEPVEVRPIACDAAEHLQELAFPSASPRVMRAERTFWEKATAAHVYYLQQKPRGDRYARHWHDLVRLNQAGYAASAVRDADLALDVARHKRLFFREKDASGATIDYDAAVSGAIRLAPAGPALAGLEQDYGQMVDDGLLLGDAEPFDVLMEGCRELEAKLNSR